MSDTAQQGASAGPGEGDCDPEAFTVQGVLYSDQFSTTPSLPLPRPDQYNTPPPMDFTQLTPAALGITAQSFIPSSQGRDKSRVSQLKARRRSSVGVRGSPETNSLICYIARQRLQTPPSRTPPPQATFSPRCSSTLRQKMASFQKCLVSLSESGQAGEEDLKETRSVQGVPPGKENRLPCNMAPPSKRPRMGVPGVDLSPSHPAPHVMNTLSPAQRRVVEEEMPVMEEEEEEVEEEAPPPAPQSPCLSQPVESTTILSPSLSPSTTQPPGGAASQLPEGSALRREKKRVRFGAPLSPELFDRRLPPDTPLQRGATPARATPHSTPLLRPLLKKTPQKATPPLPQPDFDSPTEAASPVCAPHGDEAAPPAPLDSGIPLLVFEDEPACAEPPVPDSQPTTEPTPAPEEEPISTAAPVRSRGRKRKDPPTKRTERKKTSRSAAASASGKMKVSCPRRRWGSRAVDRSLYGNRDYASKHPALSPITEALSSISCTPTPCHQGGATLQEEGGSDGWDPSPTLPPREVCADPAASTATAHCHGPILLQSVESLCSRLAQPEQLKGCAKDGQVASDGQSIPASPAVVAVPIPAAEPPGTSDAPADPAAAADPDSTLAVQPGADCAERQRLPAAKTRRRTMFVQRPSATEGEDREGQQRVRGRGKGKGRGWGLGGSRHSCPNASSLGPKTAGSAITDPSPPSTATESEPPHSTDPREQDGPPAVQRPLTVPVGDRACPGETEGDRACPGETEGDRAGPGGTEGDRHSVRAGVSPAATESPVLLAGVTVRGRAGKGRTRGRQSGAPLSVTREREEEEETGLSHGEGREGRGGWPGFNPLAGLLPWQQLSIEEALQAVPERRSVRRSMRNRRDSDATGLSWVLRPSPPARHHRRSTLGRPRTGDTEQENIHETHTPGL
ncbi:cell division cycle-associated protein 2 [Amia ocellicauda]|uniref:cell division cycle-associated protein 2 n=1 Tax=Amia ocellicauda TaxID=2972642 RepID=UPI003463A3FD